MASRQDIAQLLADSATPANLRDRLSLASDVLVFATTEMALPDNGSYRAYVDLGRPYAVANVVATPELSLAPVTWCYPVVGCTAYRGYFDEAEATAFADGLRAEGFDVNVARATAYSTLGWFKDPLPSTIVLGSRNGLIGTIVHELAHQVVYVDDDTKFNESYAVAVEREGVRRWLRAHGAAADLAGYEADIAREQQFLELVLGTRAALDALYRGPASDDEKRAGKARLFAELQTGYARLKASWGGYSGYDGWFARDLNNAHLSLVGTYADYVPGFTAMIREAGGDMAVFYAAVQALARLPKAERDAYLAARG